MSKKGIFIVDLSDNHAAQMLAEEKYFLRQIQKFTARLRSHKNRILKPIKPHLDQLALDKMADIFALFGYIKTHNPPLFVPFFEGGEFIPVKLAASELSLTRRGQAGSFLSFFVLSPFDSNT